ncbi:cytochrome P450 [Suillus spraguei]|nr:cytochrome P450 [Suillus spraguei]
MLPPSWKSGAAGTLQLVVPRDPSLPPEVFHWIPFIGSSISYGNDPLNFFFKLWRCFHIHSTRTQSDRRTRVKGNNFVLGGKSTAFPAEDAYTHLTTPVFGKDVVYDVPNEVFMEQKKFVKVGLSTESFRAYVSMFEQEVDVFMRSDQAFIIWQMNDINEWGCFDVTDVMAQITILTASWTCKAKRSGMDEPDMISALMDQKYRDGRPFRDHEVAHLMVALLMAGQHTSSASGSWILLHLAHNVEVQEALYQEQVEHFGNPDGSFRPMTYEGFRKLLALDSVIRETLRMHPPIHSIMRYVRSDVPIPATLAAPSQDGVYDVVPKGYYVLASAAVSQVDPLIWVNPMKWDPTRWNDPEGVAAQAFNTYSDENGEKIDYGFGAVSKGIESPYQPFGSGRHRCIGEQFSYLQLGVVISSIIRKVEIRLDDGIREIPAHNYYTMITMPKKPRNVRYRRRKFD